MATHLQDTPTQYVTASNGIKFAYRRLGHPSTSTDVPLVCHIYFRANIDFWDPLLINSTAERREVILFDNMGIGRSGGTVPDSYQGWADGLVSFVQALGIKEIDLLGFSMGGTTGQYVALTMPHLIRKLVVAGARPAAPIVHGAIKEGGAIISKVAPPIEHITALIEAVDLEAGKEALAFSFFPDAEVGRKSFDWYWNRLQERGVQDEPLNLTLLDKHGGRRNQVASVILDQSQSEDVDFLKSYEAAGRLTMQVLIANGDNDLLIPTSRSWELFSKTENAKLLIYPRAGHGFLWQYAQSFAGQVNEFLELNKDD